MVDVPDGHARSRSHDFLRPVTCIKVFKARATLVEDLRAEDVLCYLIQDGILGEEEEETILYEKTTKSRANKLLDVILLKGDPACRVFGNALCRTSPHLIMVLNDVTVTGSDKQAYERWRMAQAVDEVDGQPKVSRNMCVLERLSQVLQSSYRRTLQYLTPLPWNDVFHVHIDHVYTTLRTVHVQRPEWATKGIRDLLGEAGPSDLMRPSELFASSSDQNSRKNVLIEGEAGIGKSTLCQKLAYDWASAQLQNHSISRFQLVFHLNADEFQEDITATILSTLLPRDAGFSKEELATLLADPLIQESVLFIVDGCDENVHQKPQLQQLIMGKLYQNASLLVTARPALCNVFLKYFDIACVVLGFTQGQMIEFVTKYATEMKCSPKFVENLKGAVSDGHDLQDISRNPLQLWFLCLLCEEHLEELPDTRTELYEMVTNLLINRGVLKYNLDMMKALENVKVIYKLSCLAIQRGETFSISDPRLISKEQVEMLLKLGLIVKECGPSRLYPNGRCSFPHKTFQEFFSAKYLQDLSFAEQNGYLRHNRDRRWDMVMVFLCGLISQRAPQSTVRLFKNILQKDLQSAVKAVDSKSVSAELQHHSRHHLGLQCLAECPEVQGLEDIEDSIIPPTYIHNAMTCTYCLRGFVLSTQFHQNSHDFVINCIDSMAFIGKDSALKQAFAKMKQCSSLVLTNVSSRMVVTEFLSLAMGCSLQLSHLFIYSSLWMVSESVQESSKRDSYPTPKLLPKLKSLVFQGSLGADVSGMPCTETKASVAILDYLLNNIGYELKTLVIKDVEITDVLLRRLCIVFNDCSVECLTLENVTMREAHGQILFTRVADSCCIKKMHITSLKVSPEDSKLCHLSGVLRTVSSCPLQELMYRSQDVSDAFINGLFSYCTAKSLYSLDLSYVVLTKKMWDTINSHLGYLVSLKKLSLVSCGLTNANLAKFAHVCLDLLELTSLDLSNNRIGSDQHFHLFSDTIRRHSKLQVLNLEGCGITDKKMDAVLNLIESSGFNSLYLVGNPLGSEDQTAGFLSTQLQCSPSLHTLHFTCCILTTTFLADIAKNLRHSNVQDLGISCLPCSGVIGPENFFTIHKMFRSQLPKLQTFGFGVSLDIDSAREPEPENHAKWRALCL